MNINDFLDIIDVQKCIIENDGTFRNICFDSRKIKEGDIFVAIKGNISDGHDYITTAINNGAKQILCETLPENLQKGISYIQVKDSSRSLGILASEYYNNPSTKLKLIGITGTNGKTTIASTLFKLVKELGYAAGLISTIEVIINNKSYPATHTTPDQLSLNKYLSEMVDEGCDYCFMEVSSHSIVQNRIAGLKFIGGVFTNITHDHLDFHKT
ncbi:MAG TPA: Mur ligase family protein, partial [Bacteroidales bacterium]|nr:Mur ligase family protein [Bacteroidales bacterium]